MTRFFDNENHGDDAECPACSGRALINGNLVISGETVGAPEFVPSDMKLKWLRTSYGIPVGKNYTLCTECGLFFKKLRKSEVKEIHDFIEKYKK